MTKLTREQLRQKHEEIKRMMERMRKVDDVLSVARRIDDPCLLYCWECRRVVGYRGNLFSHWCEEKGPFGWTDISRKQEEIIASYEMPGTLWAERDEK